MTIATSIVFVGVLLDGPSVKRVKMLETERHVLEGEIAALQNELEQLGARRDVTSSPESESRRDTVNDEDPRLSALLTHMAALAGRIGVDFIAVRPAATPDPAGALEVELSATFRVLGTYLKELEQSRWGLTIADVHLGRSPEHAALVSARFTVATSRVLLGLATHPSGNGDGR
jgi:hypothetical protein